MDGTGLGGSVIHASFGTTKYCSFFLRGVHCHNAECLYLHYMADPEDCFTKTEMQTRQLEFYTKTHPTKQEPSSVKRLLPKQRCPTVFGITHTDYSDLLGDQKPIFTQEGVIDFDSCARTLAAMIAREHIACLSCSSQLDPDFLLKADDFILSVRKRSHWRRFDWSFHVYNKHNNGIWYNKTAQPLLGSDGGIRVGSVSLLGEKSAGLLGKQLLLLVLTLLLVDLLDQHTLGLVTVTLGQSVEVGIHMLVDLSSLTVLSQQSTKHTNATHPEKLLGDTGVHGTTALSVTSVVATSLGVVTNMHTGAGVHQLVLAHNQTVLDELTDVLAGVSEGDLVNLAGVHPHSALSALEDGSSKSLLELQADHVFGEFYQTLSEPLIRRDSIEIH